jgi:hypothetical protein
LRLPATFHTFGWERCLYKEKVDLTLLLLQESAGGDAYLHGNLLPRAHSTAVYDDVRLTRYLPSLLYLYPTRTTYAAFAVVPVSSP